MRVLRALTIALAALVLAVGAGCGGDGDDEEPAQPTGTGNGATEPAGGAETTSVKMDEYSFDPEDATVKRGASITVENDGQIAHNLTIEEGPDPKKESKKLAGTSTFLGGKSEKLEVDVQPGKHAMVCTVAGHRELGMIGTITVE